MHLRELMVLIRNRWPWDKQRYPSLIDMPASVQPRFKRRHVSFHMLKHLGQMAEIEELSDHDGSIVPADSARMQECAIKIIAEALRFAQVIGLSSEDIESGIRKFYPPRWATTDELREILVRPEEFHRLLGFEPVSSSLPGDGAGVRIVVCIKPESAFETPSEIEFETKNGRVRAAIEIRRTAEEFVPQHDPSI